MTNETNRTTQTFNVTDIWKETSNIGYSVFTNVADGTVRTVQWGHLQWLSFAGSLAVFAGLTLFAAKFIIKAFV